MAHSRAGQDLLPISLSLLAAGSEIGLTASPVPRSPATISALLYNFLLLFGTFLAKPGTQEPRRSKRGTLKKRASLIVVKRETKAGCRSKSGRRTGNPARDDVVSTGKPWSKTGR